MAAIEFRYGSMRAQKARLGKRLSGVWRLILPISGFFLILSGAGLLLIGQPVGWLIMSLSGPPMMVWKWYKYELKDVPPAKSPSTIDDVLDSHMLGLMPKNPTPFSIATLVGTSTDGMFFAARFGITLKFLQEIVSKDESQTPVIWQQAIDLQKQLELPQVTGGVLVVALVRSFDQYKDLLAHLHLEEEDLIKGIHWQQHIDQMIAHYKRPRRTGGIARDLSFGYIPLLTKFGQNISEQIARGGMMSTTLEAHEEALQKLIDTFSTSGKQNAALVGPEGVGKTTLVRAFAERLLDAEAKLPESLKFRQVFFLDASSLIAAAPGRGELEGLISQVIAEVSNAKNIILCLDNAQLFFEEGVGSVDISNVLLPILTDGSIRIILAMDEQRFLQIGQRNSPLVNALNRISVSAATQEETIAAMQDQLILTEFQHKVTFTYQSLLESYRLGDRYVYDLEMPGKAIKMMETAAGYSENGLVTINSVQTAIEQTMNIKVGVADEEGEKEKLLNLEDLIHKRMINQTRAVTVVSDALRRARAGVRNPNRPIGTFLFLGPTGVGKTELSKALADVYFGGEDRMIRLDMNEYVRPEDVSRLIADGADDPASLTAQAMKQPFSVVLFDEIEKAHPNVLTTLLQLLDEGILRDIKNREVSFRDAIVIATSNAGANRIREYIERGYQLEQFEQQFLDELINSNQFKPEFLNRFDEIVTFRPLGKEELLKVVDLILASINKTLTLQKISVSVADDAKVLLVDRGYDPRLGARPMRRVVQRAVENTVAKQMLSGKVDPGSTIEITREQVEQILGSHEEAQAIVDAGNPQKTQ